MLSEQEKKEMLADGLSRERQEKFRAGSRRKSKSPRTLNDYIAFLTDVQAIKAFEHRRGMTPTGKNIF